jgi:hypothetical protein
MRLLIPSFILMAIALTVYFFRGDLKNFVGSYSKLIALLVVCFLVGLIFAVFMVGNPIPIL